VSRKKLILLFGATGFLLLIIIFLFTDSYRILLAPLDVGEVIDPDFGDSILILGGGLRPRVEIGISTEERLWLAVQLYRQKRRKIVLSDGSLYRKSPAIEIMVRYFEKRGVPRSDLVLEGLSQTTFESCLNCREIFDRHDLKAIVVVTSPYHQKRCSEMLRFLEYPDFRVARMIRSEVYRADTFAQRMRNLKLIFREYIALVKFWVFKK
jgi:uncharacterized SAM-binding protein YcdF (DUF218 family)